MCDKHVKKVANKFRKLKSNAEEVPFKSAPEVLSMLAIVHNIKATDGD